MVSEINARIRTIWSAYKNIGQITHKELTDAIEKRILISGIIWAFTQETTTETCQRGMERQILGILV